MTQTSSFSTLGISPEVLEAIEVLGFDTPSAIQEQAIPAAIGGSDIVGLSHTGSGKTLAFAIPALECIDPDERAVQVLALCPTRELAVQICREVDKLALFMDGVSAVPIYGGSSFRPQLDALRRGVQFVVGTPGRVMDLMESGALRLDHLRMLILDEADEMLGHGIPGRYRTHRGGHAGNEADPVFLRHHVSGDQPAGEPFYEGSRSDYD